MYCFFWIICFSIFAIGLENGKKIGLIWTIWKGFLLHTNDEYKIKEDFASHSCPNHNSLLKALLFLNLKFFFHYLIPTSRLQIGQGSGERRRGLFGRTYKVKKTLTPECYISLQSNVTPTPTICELMPEQLILNAQCICIFTISLGK